MNPLHLIWIIPAAVVFGVVLYALIDDNGRRET